MCASWMALATMTFLWSLPVVGSVKTTDWGTMPDGKAVTLYTLSNAELRIELTDQGARIVSIEAPDRTGKRDNIVLGHNNLAPYTADSKNYFGAVVGRYGNRIANGTFVVSGQTFHVPVNNNGNALHGGPEGFSTRLWRGHVLGINKVEFTLNSPDGDMGFPGAMTAQVTYTLVGHELRLDYSATTTKATVVNLTNHSYFNLGGQASGDILGHQLRIDADSITPVDATLITTGELQPVSDTPFDFRKLALIGQRINANDQQLKNAGGYDHNYVLNGKSGELREAAYAIEPASGRTLTVLTTEPGIQFYSGNFLDGSLKGYTGTLYHKHAGFCLETQHYPDSPNHRNFPDTTLLPGKKYRSTTVFVFGIENGSR